MPSAPSTTTAKNTTDTLAAINRRFYDEIWLGAEIYSGDAFNSWVAVGPRVERAETRLEVGPGLRPRLPVSGTRFVDLSPVAVERLNEAGGLAVEGSIEALPVDDNSIDLLCAFDVLEHVDDDRAALRELTRVLKPGGVLFLSVPLYASAWTDFDKLCGHARRYEPDEFEALLASHEVKTVRSAAFGMQPDSRLLTSIGVWWLTRFPRHALRFYDKHIFPRVMKRQDDLVFEPGLLRDPKVDEVILECVYAG
jgi:SAM-dependent methyltransferase